MYTKKNYSLRNMLSWTRKDIYKFVVIGTIPVTLYSVFNFTWLHLPWLPIALIGTAVAFIIGFKNNASYGRLWEARQIWGGIVNTSRGFGIMVNDFINNDHTKNHLPEEELATIRKTIVHRHIAWMTAHRYTLRQPKPWERYMDNSTNSQYTENYGVHEWTIPFDEAIGPYLSEEEQKYIDDKSNKATQLLSLQSKHLRSLKERGLIWEFSYLEMEKMVVEMFTLQGKNERIKNFPYPRQFATLNLFFVWIFIIFLPFGIMNEFDEIGKSLLANIQDVNYGMFNGAYKHFVSNFVWLSVPFSVIISWVFHTMERIGEVSENPFEGTPNDVPITTMARGIEIDMREILDESPETIPAAIPMKWDSQM